MECIDRNKERLFATEFHVFWKIIFCQTLQHHLYKSRTHPRMFQGMSSCHPLRGAFKYTQQKLKPFFEVNKVIKWQHLEKMFCRTNVIYNTDLHESIWDAE